MNNEEERLEERIIEQKSSIPFNYGLALLRMLMCFEVVLCHFWSGDVPVVLTPFKILEQASVPVFFFLAFFFSAKIFYENDSIKIKKRFIRLLIPHIGWAFIYWFLFTIGELIISELNDIWGKVRISDLFWQLLTGHSSVVNASMWFQFDLIVITLLIVLIFRFCKDMFYRKIILVSLLFISFVLQYTGINIWLFGSLRYELSNPLGRIFEMIPYAVLGFFCADYNVFDRLKIKRIVFIILFALCSVFFLMYTFIKPVEGFGYSRNNNLLVAFFLIGFAYLLPLERLPDKVCKFIRFITKYTLGIYCMHRLVALVIKYGLIKSGIDFDTFVLSITAYIVSFIISFIISKIPVKVIRQLVE